MTYKIVQAEEFLSRYGSGAPGRRRRRHGPAAPASARSPPRRPRSRGGGAASAASCPTSAKQYYNAVSLVSQEKYLEAFKAFKKILDGGADPEYAAKAEFEMAKCLFYLKQYDNCIKSFTAIVQKFPKHPELKDALFFVGRSYEEKGDKAKAGGLYKKIITMGTEDDPVVRKVQEGPAGPGGGEGMSPVAGPDLSMFNRFSKTFRKGDIIFCEYEPGDTFYLIQSGRVQIVRIIGELEKNIDILNPGEVFGEMAILEEAPRSATTIALDDVKALEFNRENFEVLMMGNPPDRDEAAEALHQADLRPEAAVHDPHPGRRGGEGRRRVPHARGEPVHRHVLGGHDRVQDHRGRHVALGGHPTGAVPRGAQPLRRPAAHRAASRPDRREEHQRFRAVRELPAQAPGEIDAQENTRRRRRRAGMRGDPASDPEVRRLDLRVVGDLLCGPDSTIRPVSST